jgi:hypothetical protein
LCARVTLRDWANGSDLILGETDIHIEALQRLLLSSSSSTVTAASDRKTFLYDLTRHPDLTTAECQNFGPTGFGQIAIDVRSIAVNTLAMVAKGDQDRAARFTPENERAAELPTERENGRGTPPPKRRADATIKAQREDFTSFQITTQYQFTLPTGELTRKRIPFFHHEPPSDAGSGKSSESTAVEDESSSSLVRCYKVVSDTPLLVKVRTPRLPAFTSSAMVDREPAYIRLEFPPMSMPASATARVAVFEVEVRENDAEEETRCVRQRCVECLELNMAFGVDTRL